ncbi:MAG: amino acid ABC transporter ATP-binding protein [Gemmata sp.]
MSISAQHVTKRFGGFVALDNVSVECPAGELVALLGPSGSGKTTLLRVIAGLEVPDSGTVLFRDDDITRHSARDRNVGFVFQHYALFRHMTVFENVAFGLRVRKWPDQKVRERVMELLRLVRLEEKAPLYPANLSGGQKQRIALVRALAPEPKVLLLDEITSALDPVLVADVLEALRALAKGGMTMLIATHEMAFAADVADRICYLEGGRIVEQGSPEKIFGAPRDARTRAFLKRVRSVGASPLR